MDADNLGKKIPQASKDNTMFTPARARAASAYKNVGMETSVNAADPHELVNLLFTALLQSLSAIQSALQRGDNGTKVREIGRSIRLLDEGLGASLNEQQGGELAGNLRALYDYCVMRLTQANMKNDLSLVEEVQRLITPLAQGWTQIRAQALQGA
jgi:flagellar protein FliS